MKKIFESEWRGDGDSAQKIYVYEFANDEEYFEFSDMSHHEKCQYCDVNENNWVMPGALFYRYEFDNSTTYVVMYETVAYNV